MNEKNEKPGASPAGATGRPRLKEVFILSK